MLASCSVLNFLANVMQLNYIWFLAGLGLRFSFYEQLKFYAESSAKRFHNLGARDLTESIKCDSSGSLCHSHKEWNLP